MAEADRSADAVPPGVQMMQLATGYFVARAVYVAAELRLADLLSGGPRDAAALAAETGTHPHALYRLLRALAATGVLEHCEDDRFGLTPLGATLRSDAPGSVRAGVMMFHQPMFWRSWEALRYSVETGRPALDHIFGAPVFEYLAAHPEAAKHYDGGMTGLNAALLPAIVAAYDFTPFRRIVDVAGGHGSLLAAVLERAPHAEGLLLDLPHVAAVARRTFAERGLGTRAQAVDGSMFEAVPGGADAYLLKWILHDWDDAASAAILQRIRAAAPDHARLLIIERVLPERASASLPVRTMMMADLTMMIHLTGHERTESEFRALLHGAGWRLARVIPTGCPLSITEAEPA
jgi:hypothetical protein